MVNFQKFPTFGDAVIAYLESSRLIEGIKKMDPDKKLSLELYTAGEGNHQVRLYE